MLKHLLDQWSKTPQSWYSRRYLENISPAGFEDLKAKKILLYEVPAGDMEQLFEPRCPHGCSLVVEERAGQWEAICLDHPKEGTFQVAEDQLSRYRFSVENLLKRVCSINGIDPIISPFDGGYLLGSMPYGGKRIGLILLPAVRQEHLFKVRGLVAQLKDYAYLFVIAPCVDISQTGVLDDSTVLLALDEVLNYKTLEFSLDTAILRLRQREVLKDVRLEIPGNVNAKGENEIRINGQMINISDAPFMLLLRITVGALRDQDRWVSVNALTSDPKGICTAEGVYQAVKKLKDIIKPYLPGDDRSLFLESGTKRYRLASNVTEIAVNREKLCSHSRQLVRRIVQKLPQTKKR